MVTRIKVELNFAAWSNFKSIRVEAEAMFTNINCLYS